MLSREDNERLTRVGPGIANWSVNVFLMPFHKLISYTPLSGHVWALIDDGTTMNWSMDYNPERPLTDEEEERSR